MRRGELLNIVARQVSHESFQYGSINELLNSVHQEPLRRHLEAYWRLVTQCYQINQAKCLNGVPSIGGFDHLSATFLSGLLTEGFSDDSEETTFEVILKVPSTSALLQLPIDTLIGLRRYEGAAYFSNVKEWCGQNVHSDTSNPSDVEGTARRYAQQLVDKVAAHEDAWHVVAKFWKAATKTTTRSVLTAVGGVGLAGAATVPVVGPFVPVVTAAGAAGFVLWRVAFPEREDVHLRGVRHGGGAPEISLSGDPAAPSVKTAGVIEPVRNG